MSIRRDIMLVGALVMGAALLRSRPVWATPPQGQQYDAAFRLVEDGNGLPLGLLSRMALQESNYNAAAVSPAGAVGLMQIVPRWHPDANPWDPIDSIIYAGEFLADLRDRYDGDLAKALAAYNYGPGNVDKHLAANEGRLILADRPDIAPPADLPTETRRYVLEIAADVGIPV